MAYELTELADRTLSVAMTQELDRELGVHVHKPRRQEDLAFAYWYPSYGAQRLTAVLNRVVWPVEGDRILSGNVSFLPDYIGRVLEESPPRAGVALIHGHLTPGWQAMSDDDDIAERVRLAGAVAGQTGLPLVGLTRGTDGAWSGRFWPKRGPRDFVRIWADDVRVVGRRLSRTTHPTMMDPAVSDRQSATVSVWGHRAQKDLAQTHVGVVGLGSVGSLVAEALARTGIKRLTYIDFDCLEARNLDRTVGATTADLAAGLSKVQVAARTTAQSATADDLELRVVEANLLSQEGAAAALDCDVLVSCVDRPLPRHLLNTIALSHLVPIVDGGVLARVTADGRPLHVDWRVHTVACGRACLVCLGALRRSDVSLDRAGLLDDPDYIANLPESERALSRRNVFAFSMSVAAHEVLQLIGLVTGFDQIGGAGPQHYHAYPGSMEVDDPTECEAECEYFAETATAADLASNLIDRPS